MPMSAISIHPMEPRLSMSMIQSTPNWSRNSKCRREFIRTKCGSVTTVCWLTMNATKPKKSHKTGHKGFDISAKSRPGEIALFKTAGKGVHRFTFDGRYAYLSPTFEGYVGNIVMIVDLKDPTRPEEVGRWWMPGQWTAG